MDKCLEVIDSPVGKVNVSNQSSRSSFGSYDSGYLTLTPQPGCQSPSTGSRVRLSNTSIKRSRFRNDPLQSERITRLRSKFSTLLENTCCEENDKRIRSSLPDKFNPKLSFNESANHSMLPEYQEFGMELRNRNLRSWRATVPINPADDSKLLASPPSPAIPSSSFQASEPDEDVEMKALMHQSTPHASTLKSSYRSIRKSTPELTSVDRRRLSRLVINDLITVPEIKPKRLDFSQKGLSASFRRRRATRDQTGVPNVDMLVLLGEKSNHWRVISNILALLSPQDLCSVSMVSKAWQRICASDSKANVRRLIHIKLKQDVKENLKFRKGKLEMDITTSPRSRFTRKGYLLEVQNLIKNGHKSLTPSSPPVSPSKVKFHSFVKASRTLAPWEHLLPCPRCTFPCHVDIEKNVGKCSRQSCCFEFCAMCSSSFHNGPCKTPLLATPTKKRNKPLVVGSRQSKRNLRRL